MKHIEGHFMGKGKHKNINYAENITNSGKQYLEPVGFKGTEGKWRIDNIYQSDKNEWVVGIITDKDGSIVDAYGNTEHEAAENAKLISQSKELAKALQDIIEWSKYYTEIGLYRMGGNALLDNLKNAKQVLKDAGLII